MVPRETGGHTPRRRTAFWLAAERARRLHDLRELGASVQRIISQAQEHVELGRWWADPQWRCEEQNLLDLLLTTVEQLMAKCHAVIGESGAAAVLSADREARAEIKLALKG